MHSWRPRAYVPLSRSFLPVLHMQMPSNVDAQTRAEIMHYLVGNIDSKFNTRQVLVIVCLQTPHGSGSDHGTSAVPQSLAAMSRELAKRRFRVIVYAALGPTDPIGIDSHGVLWVPLELLDWLLQGDAGASVPALFFASITLPLLTRAHHLSLSWTDAVAGEQSGASLLNAVEAQMKVDTVLSWNDPVGLLLGWCGARHRHTATARRFPRTSATAFLSLPRRNASLLLAGFPRACASRPWSQR